MAIRSKVIVMFYLITLYMQKIGMKIKICLAICPIWEAFCYATQGKSNTDYNNSMNSCTFQYGLVDFLYMTHAIT